MTVRLVPAGIAAVAVLVAFNGFIRPTAAHVNALRDRVQEEEGRLAAASSEGSIMRTMHEQQRALAVRLRQERALDAGTSEAYFVADLTLAAASCGVALESVSATGTPSPLSAAISSSDGPATASTSPSGAVNAQRVQGTRLQRSVVIEGSLAGVLRFVDRLGRLREPVRLNGFTLSQHAQLQATIDIDVLVIDQKTLLEAQG